MQPSRPVPPRASLPWRIAQYPPVALLIGLLMVIASGIAVSAVAHLLGAPRTPGRPGSAAVAIAAAAAAVGAYLAFVRWVERRPQAEFAPAGAGRELAAGLVAGLLLFSAVVGAIALLGGYRITGLDPRFSPWPALMVGLVPGFLEETVARGLIFRELERWLGSWVALAVSAALFGAAHLLNANATLFAGLAIALEAGVMLAAAYMLTRRLWGAIGLHAGWNATQGGLWGVPVSGGAMHGVFASRSAGPAWLTGGPFGAEASVPALLICTAFGIALLVLCVRRDRVVPFLPGRG